MKPLGMLYSLASMLTFFAPKINLKIAWIYMLGNVNHLQLHLYGFTQFKIELHGFTFTLM